MANKTDRLAAAAGLLLASVTQDRIRTARSGEKICARATAWRELEAVVELYYPGFVAHLREAR